MSYLDELLDKVIDKDGRVDYILMHSRDLRVYFALLRALGGATIGDTVTLPSGEQVPAYRNTPIFRNDYIPIDEDKGTSTGVCSHVFAGTIDEGSEDTGIAGITARNASGVIVEAIGTSETKDEDITRVKWYCGLANFSELGLAAIDAIHP